MELKKRGIAFTAIHRIAGRLIVSCQAPEGDPFRSSESLARFARAAVAGGAAGIRANGPEDIRAIHEMTSVPIIGLEKRMQPDGRVLITPSFEDAVRLVEAGAAIIAVDCTARGQKAGALDRVRRIRDELGVPVIADIATVEEAARAVAAGADIIASTMRGYTDETAFVQGFDADFIAAITTHLDVPVVAEGRIQSPAHAAQAIAAGAWAVIVGTAITRPQMITARFARAVEQASMMRRRTAAVLGIDLGGTNTKSAIVLPDGRLCSNAVVSTPASGGRDALLAHLHNVAQHGMHAAGARGLDIGAVGVATAGWVDEAGRVVWATSNLPGWTGTAVAGELQSALGLPVAVENDANALAIAESRFGAARGIDDFVCLTLGTGVGGGCYIGGRLARGAHSLGNALGHISIEFDGLTCGCGQRGCLEMYVNAAALLRYAGDSYTGAGDVIRAAHSGDSACAAAIRTLGRYLAAGLASIAHLLDPELVLISGGLAQSNDLLFSTLRERVPGMLIGAGARKLDVRPSVLGYYGGVLGAAVLAMEGQARADRQARPF